MNDSKISIRYGKALFMSAREQDVLSSIRDDMDMILAAVNEITELRQLLESPIIDRREKKDILKAIFGDRIHMLSLQFFDMVLDNNREEFLAGMARTFIKYYKEEKGIKVASLKTAVSTDVQTKKQLTELIKDIYRSEIELSDEVDERLIGGFVLTVEDLQMDASVAGQLQKIRKGLAGKL